MEALKQAPWDWIVAYLPTLLSFLVLVAATLESHQSALGNHHVYLGAVPHAVDVAVRHYGMLLPFSVLLLQQLVLPYGEIAELGVIGHWKFGQSWLHWTQKWIWGVFLLWFVLAVVRLVLFLFVRPWHLYFSDHLFLIGCVMAQLQTKIFLLYRVLVCMNEKGSEEQKTRTRLGISVVWRAKMLMVATWLMVAALLLESFFTAKYFHSVFADWSAFLSATVLFGGIAGCWMYKLRNSRDSNNADYNTLQG